MSQGLKNLEKCVKAVALAWLVIVNLPVVCLAQSNYGLHIEAITFDGLQNNKESYLLQFIQSQIGDSPSDSLLLQDVQRLKNIPSIGNASFTLDTFYNAIEVIFQAEEVKTILPIIDFGTVTNNTWVRLGLYDSNWQGNGSFLSATYQIRDGHRHGGQLYYRASRISGSEWGLSATLNRLASQEPLFFNDGIINYDYTNNEVGLTVIRQLGYRHQLELGGTYFTEKYVKSKNQTTDILAGPARLTQPKYLSKLEYTADFLNYHYFYLSGFKLNVAFQNVFTVSDKSWFRSLQLSGKYFAIVNDNANLAIRLRAAVATNTDSPFAPFVIDSHVNIRGVGNRVARGTAELIANIEYRVTAYDSKKWGVQSVFFLDMATWRNPGKDLDTLFESAQSRQFLGGGFRFIYKEVHGAVIRIDYGTNIQDITQGGVVIGFGQYF